MGRKHTAETIAKITATRTHSVAARPVITPMGRFDSINKAAKAHGCTGANIYKKVKNNTEGYSYEQC